MKKPHVSTIFIAVTATGCLLLSACGKGSWSALAPGAASSSARSAAPVAKDAAGNSTQACSPVTEQDAAKALGKDPGRGQALSQSGASSCTYGAYPALVRVNVVPGLGKAAFLHARGLAPKVELVDVPGIGDSAFGVFAGPAASIEFYKGQALVVILLETTGSGSSSEARAKAVAKRAASRL